MKNILALIILTINTLLCYAQPSLAGCSTSGTGITVGSSCTGSAMSTTGSNTDYWDGATTDGCSTTDGDFDDVWWWFTATSTSTTITYNSTNDAVLTLFVAACNTNMTSIACADATSSGDETIVYATTIGTIYKVRAQRYNSNANMAGTICVYNTPAGPSNDNPCGAISLDTIKSTCSNISGTITGATGTTGIPTPSCGPTSTPFTDVWYSFTATSTTTNIQTEALTGTSDMTMQVLTNSSGCSGTWTQVACDDDNNPSNAMPYISTLSSSPNPLTTVIGQRYYIRIYPYTSGSSGTFNLCAYNVLPPNCTTNTTPANTSTNISLTPTLSWAAASGATGYDVYLGTTNPPTTLVSTNNASTSFTVSTALSGSTTYYWYVVPRNAAGLASGCSSTTTSFTTLTPPINDNCNNAIALTVNPTSTLTTVASFTNTGATQSQVGCIGTADDDVWFYFDAVSTTHNFGVTSSTSADLVHQVFSAPCAGSGSSLICSDPNTSTGECFVPGQRYYVRVYTYGNNTSGGTITLGVGTISKTIDATCLTASQICAPFSFTAGVNQPSGGAGCNANYSCLITTPNPEYHWLLVTNTGTLDYTLSSTAGDVDFALWRISGTPMPATTCGGTQTINCGSSLGTPVACSYSISATEVINTAVTPGYYLLLATNYANVNGIISLTANAGNNALVSCPCIISELTATPSACNSINNLYATNGTLTYNSNAPTSGSLIIRDNNGNEVIYNYPFPSSPISYSIPNNVSDTAIHTVRAQFTDNAGCMRCVNYTAPANCCSTPEPAVINIVDAGCGYTYDLSAILSSGGPFEWSTSVLFSPIIDTVGIIMPFGTNTTTYYVRKVGYTCINTIVARDTTPPTAITNGNCMTCTVNDGQTRTFYDASNNLIATITDPSGSSNLGITTACATVESADITHNSQDYMRRHFDIDVTNNGPATVTLYLSDADITNLINSSADDAASGYGVFNSMADLCITAYDGLAETPASHTTATVIPHSALTIAGPFSPGNYYTVTYDAAGFSGFYCHACNPTNNPLPVDFISFDGYHSNGINNLRWTTASEINNDKFEIYRSIDASNWEYIGEVDGNGNSSIRNSYTYLDNKLIENAYYYRLKQIDFDSKFEYSNIIYLSNSSISINNIYPNPAQNNIYFSLASDLEKSVTINIINIDGKIITSKIHTIYKGANNIMNNIRELPSGIYIIQVIDNVNNDRIQNTFIKE